MERFYGYGIVDRDGERYFDVFTDKEYAEKRAATFNGAYSPYRVVELFYKEDQ